MKPQTLETIAQLKEANWFEYVGKKDTPNASVLSSWEEALLSCSNDKWQDILLEARNRYTEKLMDTAKTEFQNWNTFAETVKKETVPLVESKVSEVVKNFTLPKIFVDTVQWDILHCAMEAEFSHVVPPGFYASQGYWYIKGHFPCGWEGTFPEGRLIIY